jgi:hypothetical protein
MKLPVLAARAAAGRWRNKEGSHRREATTRSPGVRAGWSLGPTAPQHALASLGRRHGRTFGQVAHGLASL